MFAIQALITPFFASLQQKEGAPTTIEQIIVEYVGEFISFIKPVDFKPKIEVSGLYVLNNKNEVLFLLRKKDHKWGVPAGKLDPKKGDRDKVDCVLRETEEEIGWKLAPSEVSFVKSCYVIDQISLIYHIFIHRGIPKEVTLSDEHEKARWMTPIDAIQEPSIIFGTEACFEEMGLLKS